MSLKHVEWKILRSVGVDIKELQYHQNLISQEIL